MDDEKKEPNLTSWFVSKSIKLLRSEHYVRAIISYADSKYHHGYIYQATNFKYYGLTPKKCDFFAADNRGGTKQIWRGSVKGCEGEWIPRSRKHRYMLVYDDTLKIKWPIQPYPKGDNHEYELSKTRQTQLSLFDVI